MTEAVIERLSMGMDAGVLRAMLRCRSISFADQGRMPTAAAKAISRRPAPQSAEGAHRARPDLRRLAAAAGEDRPWQQGGDGHRQCLRAERRLRADREDLAEMLAGLVQAGATVKRGETARAVKCFKEALDWLLERGQGRHVASSATRGWAR